MDIKSEKTVWIHVESDRYFIISDDQVLPEGPFWLKTVDGKERSVQDIDVNNYEVTEQEAYEWLTTQVNEQMNRAKEAVKHAFAERKKEEELQLATPQVDSDTTSNTTHTSPALTMVTTEKGGFESFDSFSEPPENNADNPASSHLLAGDEDQDAIKEAISILNRAVSDIQLTAARATADLQRLMEKYTAKSPA